MRGRLGGIIGVASQPNAGSASRIWSLAELYSAKRGAYYTDMYGYGLGPWPTNTLTINLPTENYSPIDWVDATATGGATLSPTVSTPSPGQEFSYFWQRSTDDGATWATVSGSSGTATTDYDYNSYSGGGVATVSLALTGQTVANDEDRYRLVASSGLKTFVGPAITVRFDTVTIDFVDQPWANLPGDLGFWSYPTTTTTKTVSAGDDVEIVCGFVITGQKYAATYAETSIQWQTSTDGGSTWTNGTGVTDYQPADNAIYFNAAAGDNGRKWRATIYFNATSVTTRVITLTVT